MCFATDCQKGSLLGSKELGTNVLEFQCVMLANHDQNLESRFRLLKVIFVKSWNRVIAENYCLISARLDRSKIRLDRSNLVQNVPV